MSRGELDERGRAITANNEDIRIDSQVFAISTAYIQSYRSRGQLFEKLLDYRPWLRREGGQKGDEPSQIIESHLVASGREMGCDLLVYIMDMLGLVLCTRLICCRHVARQSATTTILGNEGIATVRDLNLCML